MRTKTRKKTALSPAARAELVARAIADGDKSPAAITDAVRGCGADVWHLLDAKPGAIWAVPRGEWHPYLRQVRNSPRDGRRLLAAVSEQVSA